MKRALLLLAFFASGCVPSPSPAPATHPPTYCYKAPTDPGYPVVAQAIHDAFYPYGQTVIEEAGRVACCESSWRRLATNGQYRGIFQLGSHFDNTIRFYSAKRGYPTNWVAWWDEWVSSQVARDLWLSRGRNWSGWECRP